MNPLRPKRQCPCPERFTTMVASVVGPDVHEKRVKSLANAVLGCFHGAELGVASIGASLAAARGLNEKHAIKQVDRLLSNIKFDPFIFMQNWIHFRLGSTDRITVAMDWTDFDDQDHSVLSISQVSKNGRSSALYWKTFVKSKLKGVRGNIERECLTSFQSMLPVTCTRTHVIADRGFGEVPTQKTLEELGFFYALRLMNNVYITAKDGETRLAAEWALPSGRARQFPNAKVTDQKHSAAAVIVKHDKGMKEPWALVTNDPELTANQAVKMYSRRFSCEELFRDIKDQRFGMGLLNCRIKDLLRRDRILWLAAVAQHLLTMLGQAGESIGLNRRFQSNTSRKRQNSLLRQRVKYYQALLTLQDEWARPLLAEFDRLLRESGILASVLEVGQ